MSENTEALLDLTFPRTIVLEDRGRPFILNCRRITDADWSEYFAGIVVTSERVGKSVVNVVDVSSPRVALAEAVLSSAEGYKVAGGGPLMEIPDWRKRIPLSHRLQLGEVLADARVSQPTEQDFTIYPEGEVVSLDATWSGAVEVKREDESTGFAMQRFRGLKHVLKTPTQEQHARYASQASRARVIGGSRSGKTVYPGANVLLAKLYDELIVSVDGYRAGGQARLSVDLIRTEMDMLHKVMVAQELFQPQNTAQLAGETTGE